MSDDTTGPCELSANENPSPPSSRVTAAVIVALQRLNRYPDREDDELRDAVAGRLGRGVTPAHIVTGASGSDVLELMARALLDPDDEAVVCPPTFTVYAPTIRRQRARVVEVPLDPDSFALDVDAVLRAVTPRTRLVYVCNPGNPTGVIVPAAAIDALIAGLPPRVVVVADEVYVHYVRSPQFPDSVGHVLAGRPVVVVHSFSKAYALAGLRLGYAVTTPELAASIGSLKRKFHLGRLDVAAGVAALGDQEFLQRSVALVHQEMPFFYETFRRLAVRCWPSEGNFVLFRAPGDAAALQRELMARGMRVRTTDINGLPGHLRVTVGLPDENRRFARALEEALACA
ncbi:MAG: aminotransferase class I/II-fold pyridoxal phosphate-dependent enzyme [Acidobacteriota bacterium]|nr:aminotransferase class I/II-fold pyridoxal phosphate-dependent enzyme [Acidobacteriota bacterium]